MKKKGQLLDWPFLSRFPSDFQDHIRKSLLKLPVLQNRRLWPFKIIAEGTERFQNRKADFRWVLVSTERRGLYIPSTAHGLARERVRPDLRLLPSIPLHKKKKSRPAFRQANQPRVPLPKHAATSTGVNKPFLKSKPVISEKIAAPVFT